MQVQATTASCTCKCLLLSSICGKIFVWYGPSQSLRPLPSSSPFLRKPPCEPRNKFLEAGGTRIRMPVDGGESKRQYRSDVVTNWTRMDAPLALRDVPDVLLEQGPGEAVEHAVRPLIGIQEATVAVDPLSHHR
jgi:hypothetical protein